MRIGSLFSGAGGLDMAVQSVFGGEVIWHSEIDKAASKVLAYRWPDVPNLGSITEIDWAAVPPVDVLCGGFPCQDVSAAGKRAGIKDGTRSGLWSVFAEAIDALRPRFVVIENVRGLLSATAHRDVEPGDTALGIGGHRPVLRAGGAVVGTLADLGYDAQWATVAAADVGAPHRRERVFIVASVADANGERRISQELAGGMVTAQPRTDGHRPPFPSDAAHASRHGWDEGRPESAGIVGGSDAALGGDEPGVALLPTPTTQDASNCAGPSQFERNTVPLNAEVTLLPTPEAKNSHAGPDYARANRDGSGGDDLVTIAVKADRDHQWGKYAPAIHRWELLTRPAPAPTEPNKNGNPRLSAAFSEWLMGWPDGWVTDPAIGISRNDQLRIVGNGVCPQQAAAALRYLLAVTL